MTTAFQPNAFQNPEVYDHLGFQVAADITPDPVSALTVDQTVQMLSDQWELALNSSDPWRARSRVSSVDLSTGLIDALGDRDMVKHVQNGKPDEWELEFRPDQIVGRMRGRDAMAYALDAGLKVSYITGGQPFTPPPPEKLPPGLRPIPGVTTRVYKPGAWRASTVIRDLCERVGLDCSYQAPDYVLREDVEIDGSALSAIQQIIAPFCSFEPFKVDVWVEGKTLMVRQRQGLVESPGPLGPSPGALNTVSVHDARITQLMIRAHFLGFIRIFQATGGLLKNCGGIIGPDFDPMAPGAQFDSKYEQTGNGSSQPYVTTFSRWRKVDHALMNTQITKTNFRKTTQYTHEDPLFDQNCKMINSPKCTGWQTLIEGQDPNVEDGAMTGLARETGRKFYDDDGFLKSEEIIRDGLVDGAFAGEGSERTDYIDNGTKIWSAVTTRFDKDNKETASSEAPGSGYRPGGPGRAPKERFVDLARAFKNAVIDLDAPGAQDFSFTNASLRQDAINTIYEQAVASSGAQEYEVQFTAAAIPWIKKGMMLKLTGLYYEDGVTPVDLPEFLVLDCRLIHTENGANPSSLHQVKGVFWSKVYGEGA